MEPMRWLGPALCVSIVLALACPAAAIELELVSLAPGSVEPGDLVEFEVYLDTQGEQPLWMFSAGLKFDPTRFAYEPDLSSMPSYVLYVPRYWYLVPSANPPPLWPVPPFDQVNVAFHGNDLSLHPGASGEHVWLATVVFRALSTPGPGAFVLSFDSEDAIFILDPETEVTDDVTTIGGTSVTVGAGPEVPLLAPLGAVLFAATLGVSALVRSRPRRGPGD